MTDDPKPKAREWWINDDDPEPIHVVERSALAAAEAEIERLSKFDANENDFKIFEARLKELERKDKSLIECLNELLGSNNLVNPHLGVAAGAALLRSERDQLKERVKETELASGFGIWQRAMVERDQLKAQNRGLREALIGDDCSSVREGLALMAEGEGSDWRVYRDISKAALRLLDEALKKYPEE